MSNEPQPGQRWMHRKGGVYRIAAVTTTDPSTYELVNTERPPDILAIHSEELVPVQVWLLDWGDRVVAWAKHPTAGPMHAVIYHNPHSLQVWARPYDMFMDGRFWPASSKHSVVKQAGRPYGPLGD